MGTILKINKNEYVYNEILEIYFDKDSNKVRREVIINEILEYINEHNLGDYVFIWNCMNEFDSENNMQQGTAPVNMRNTKIEERGINGVHPAESGLYQCSDAAFRVFINNI